MPAAFERTILWSTMAPPAYSVLSTTGCYTAQRGTLYRGTVARYHLGVHNGMACGGDFRRTIHSGRGPQRRDNGTRRRHFSHP